MKIIAPRFALVLLLGLCTKPLHADEPAVADDFDQMPVVVMAEGNRDFKPAPDADTTIEKIYVMGWDEGAKQDERALGFLRTVVDPATVTYIVGVEPAQNSNDVGRVTAVNTTGQGALSDAWAQNLYRASGLTTAQSGQHAAFLDALAKTYPQAPALHVLSRPLPPAMAAADGPTDGLSLTGKLSRRTFLTIVRTTAKGVASTALVLSKGLAATPSLIAGVFTGVVDGLFQYYGRPFMAWAFSKKYLKPFVQPFTETAPENLAQLVTQQAVNVIPSRVAVTYAVVLVTALVNERLGLPGNWDFLPMFLYSAANIVAGTPWALYGLEKDGLIGAKKDGFDRKLDPVVFDTVNLGVSLTLSMALFLDAAGVQYPWVKEAVIMLVGGSGAYLWSASSSYTKGTPRQFLRDLHAEIQKACLKLRALALRLTGRNRGPGEPTLPDVKL